MAAKNPCAKTVKPENAYETWETGGWTWKVCKKYQAPEAEAKNPYARWFCFVTSPFCPEGEYGDTYVNEITRSAVRVS